MTNREAVDKYRTTNKYLRNQRNAHYLRKYGITIEDYEIILEEQGGVCAICKREERAKTKRKGHMRPLSVDHCHTSLEVRGLLCNNCNVGLGTFEDNPDFLLNAIVYLKENNLD